VTATHTTTGTQSPSATYTKTLTPTHSSTFTSTASPTRTYSKTPTFSSTFTVTGTRSPSATFTKTWTITPTPTITPGVFQFVVSTKPDAQGRISFSWGVNIPAERVYLKIYTSGYRLARDFEFNKLDSPDYLTKGTHMFYWNGKDEQNRPMPPGSYLCLIDINVKKKVYEASSKTQIP
jgi:hypothetical protein